MTIDDQIKDEKLEYDINREASTLSPLSSSKNDKYEYLTGEEILPSKITTHIKEIKKQAKFTYSPFEKAFENQTKTTYDQKKNKIKQNQLTKFFQKIMKVMKLKSNSIKLVE